MVSDLVANQWAPQVFGSIPASSETTTLIFGWTRRGEVRVEELQLHRILVTGHPDGVVRAGSDELPIDAPVLRNAINDAGALLDAVERVAPYAPVRNGVLAAVALALKQGDLSARRRAAAVAPLACGQGRDLLLLAHALRRLGGFGRLTRKALARWYEERPVSAIEAEGNTSANGWRHRDVLRMCHAQANSQERRAAIASLALAEPRVAGDTHRPALRWPSSDGRRLIALDASATLECGSLLGERPKRVAARWGLAGAAAGDRLVTFRRCGWRDARTRWRTGIAPLRWTGSTSLRAAESDLASERSGPPDPGLLVRYAQAHRLEVDAFVVVGARFPAARSGEAGQALARYRAWCRRPGTMVFVGLKPGGHRHNDPSDRRSWGVDGFGVHTPQWVARLADL